MEAIKKIGIAKQIKNISIIIISSLILTISSKIQTPLAPVPVTMQTFAVFQGAIGLPVFAKGGGLIYFQGPTSGYLFGFIIGAFASGYFKVTSGALLTFVKLVFSVSFIYLFGLIWLWINLNFYAGKELSFIQVFEIGAKPFLIIEIYKLLILAVLAEKIFKIRKFI